MAWMMAWAESAIEEAKSTLHIAYGHTSHGSQLISGMGSGLDPFMHNNYGTPTGLYTWSEGGGGGASLGLGVGGTSFTDGEGFALSGSSGVGGAGAILVPSTGAVAATGPTSGTSSAAPGCSWDQPRPPARVPQRRASCFPLISWLKQSGHACSIRTRVPMVTCSQWEASVGLQSPMQ